MAAEEPPQARWTFVQAVRVRQPGLDFRQRHVRLLPDQRQQPILVLFDGLRPTIPTAWKRSTTACRRQPLRPTDGRAGAHFENTRGTTAGGTFLNRIDDTLTQIQRIRGWHGFLPGLPPGKTRKLRRFPKSPSWASSQTDRKML
jgi:hypothetical protein